MTCPYRQKKIIDHLNLTFIWKEVGYRTDRILVIETEIYHLVGIDKDKTLDPTTGNNHKADAYNMEMIVGEEVIDIKIITEMTVEIEGDKTLGEILVMTIEVDQEKEA